MKKLCFVILLLASLPAFAVKLVNAYQQGTVIRMRIGGCSPAQHRFMTAMSGGAVQAPDEQCPEYTLISDKVVYVIVGKYSNQLIPLAENIDFRFQNNEIAVRLDDDKHEARFHIKEMVLRSEWDEGRQISAEDVQNWLRRHVQEVTTAQEH
jgi:hypothetical protein